MTEVIRLLGNWKLTTKDLALTVTFTALYVVFGIFKISPIIGLPGQAITAAAIMAPVIGITLGPYVGTLSVLFGGIIGFYINFFALPSVASGVSAALCGGLIHKGKRFAAFLVYFLLFIFLTFYPRIGSAWLFPSYVWFQVFGLLVLVSPLMGRAVKNFASDHNESLLYAFFVTSLVSTLSGQIAGSLANEIIQISDPNYFFGVWVSTTSLYPAERIIIALCAAFVGASLVKVLKRAGSCLL